MPTMSGLIRDSAMTSLPGRARLATRPVPTASPASAMTMGMVVGRLHGRPGRRLAGRRHDDINREPDQFNRERGQLIELALRITACQDEVLAPPHSRFLAEPLRNAAYRCALSAFLPPV